MLTALLCDDEPMARARLRDLLAEVPDFRIVGEAADGEDAVRRLDALEPDVVFLDIQMPGCTGIEVLERARHRPVVVFTTAFDRFAVAAFELAAVDYLLKPFGRERLAAALERTRAAVRHGDQGARERAASLLADRGPVDRLFVRERGRIVLVPVGSISRVEARDDHVALVTDGHRYLMHITLNELERRLDPARFLRIHRTHLVNLDRVRLLDPYDGTRLMVEMTDGTRLLASRSRSRQLRGLAR